MESAFYRESQESHLCQGDILKPETLRPHLKGHQDYFANGPYFYRLMVITQTCDLAREKDRCNFIFIAVIRKLSEAIGIRQFEDGARDTTRRLLQDMLTYRYNKRGFFYLPQNEQQGIEEPSVVDLRVMFSLHKAHHGALVNARCGGIAELYAVQLGQLIGQMFNRVAMPDMEKRALDESVTKVMESIGKREKVKLGELTQRTSDGTCAIAACKETASTYRWLRVVVDNDAKELEHVLCVEHARQHDNGRLSAECTIKADR